ncbi:hypothetical protein BDB00DRAFT_877052 [Zychaea mexicana]|uniref:uncharacterized protein n=1 Tax=Zychaea mexicana TaxID=64656 RepID=UPI0022FEBB79|nr:uncharacterized protein BDB00DRAFT_877052 [Zychaea mexicana]KAI9488787.1 hypothetical protein BDB00DRAFT_877052 [Zychaea mexicana]
MEHRLINVETNQAIILEKLDQLLTAQSLVEVPVVDEAELAETVALIPHPVALNTKGKMVKKANKDDVKHLLLQGYHQFEGGALIKAKTDIKHIRERVVVVLEKRLRDRADNSATCYFAKLQSKDSNWAISLFTNLAKKQGIDFAVC